MCQRVAGQIQLASVDIEELDVVEDPLDVVDDPTHRRGVAVSRPQRRHAPPQGTDELVKFGEFSSAGQRISSEGGMDHSTATLDTIQRSALA